MARVARFCFALGIAWLSGAMTPAVADITFIGKGSIPGDATDLSGLTGTYTDPALGIPVPANQLGTFGSGIAYSGRGDVYYAVNDRGLTNGEGPGVAYADRMQAFRIAVDPASGTVTPTLIATPLLTDAAGRNFVGAGSAFTGSDPTRNLRLDPEAVVVARDGTLYIADELGPNIYHFDAQGRQLGVVAVPAKFQVPSPRATAAAEVAANTTGRVTNRGLEGLTITPDGSKLVAALQNPLIQDGGTKGVNTRILTVDVATGETHEYVYQLSDKANVVSEILAINDREFLVVERDKNAGDSAAFKKTFRIDLAGATDVSDLGTTAANGLPASGLPAGVTPVSKGLFLDLLDPTFGLAGSSFPEKIEGMTWGADLADGRHLLLFTSDNDGLPTEPSNFYAFAVDPSSIPGLVRMAPVPEPASAASAAIGLAALAVAARLRRRPASSISPRGR